MSAQSRQVGGDHYVIQHVQPWDAMKEWLTDEEFKGYLRGNIIKYIARANYKHESPLSDYQKAAHYIEKLIEVETKYGK